MAREPRRKDGGSYAVGFGKPPERTRFRKGRSGNPAGRPRGALDVATLLQKALAEKVVVKDASGRRREISKLEAALTQMVNKAAGADPRAMRMLLDLLAKQQAREGCAPPQGVPEVVGAAAPPARALDYARLTTAQLSTLRELMEIVDGEREYPPCPMPPADPGNPSGTLDPPLRWYTPSPGDQSDDDGASG